MIGAGECLSEVLAALGPDLSACLNDPGIWTDLMVNSDGRVWVDREGITEVKCRIPKNGLVAAASTLASYSGLSFNGREGQSLACIIPVLGYRAEFIGPPAVKGTVMVVRRPSPHTWTLAELTEKGTIGQEQADILSQAVKDRHNIVVSGGTGSGKTTLTNALIAEINVNDRLYVVEDVDEIRLHQPDSLKLLVNREYPYARAIADALRCRPDRIIVGECRRGDQVLEMIKAWNTGHPGGITTIHANDARAALLRLDQLVGEVSVSSQKDVILDTIGFVVHMDRIRGTGDRIVSQILDVRKDEVIYEKAR